MASKRRLRAKACDNKVRYKTRAEARKVLLDLQRHWRSFDLHYYRCPYGMHFHIGHLTAQQRRIKEARRAT